MFWLSPYITLHTGKTRNWCNIRGSQRLCLLCPERLLPWCLPLWDLSKERDLSRLSLWCPLSCLCFLVTSEWSRDLLWDRDRDFFLLWPCLFELFKSSLLCLAFRWGEPWLWCLRGLSLWLRDLLLDLELYVPDRLRLLL